MAEYHKLVRDKIPDFLDEKGISYEKGTASPEEYKRELIKILLEKAEEFSRAGDIEELADVMEVVEALKKLTEYKEVEKVRAKKARHKGKFDKKIILKGDKD